ncbi:CAMK family protein kinase [Tritrichomonas foetus]|uniref:CAMK family protein kinase n=1 Tax=Tritrichomonas foetus TaxID=1144522 RepID=A0A1J4JM53_9EUKA|nr:CAMK family protein kinase [Tritrichomonas foetus]|eukprot:OHT00147.1 CAMK family protein kinase [Tritrichomonas foetus]
MNLFKEFDNNHHYYFELFDYLSMQSLTPPTRVKQYRLLSLLHKSPNSFVYAAVEPSTSEKLVIKLIDTTHTPFERYETETSLMNSMNQRYVMRIKKSFDCGGFRVLIMSRAAGGDLHAAVHGGKITSLSQCAKIMYRLLSATDYLHTQRILHGDIKDANVLLLSSTSDDPKPALTDFGFAVVLPESEKCHCNLGTGSFASPELLNLEPHSFQSDIWSLGVTFYVLLSGKEPYQSDNLDYLRNILPKRRPTFSGGFFDEAPPSLIKMVESMMALNQIHRPTARHCMESPFFREILGNEWIAKENAEIFGQYSSNGSSRSF